MTIFKDIIFNDALQLQEKGPKHIETEPEITLCIAHVKVHPHHSSANWYMTKLIMWCFPIVDFKEYFADSFQMYAMKMPIRASYLWSVKSDKTTLFTNRTMHYQGFFLQQRKFSPLYGLLYLSGAHVRNTGIMIGRVWFYSPATCQKYFNFAD